MAYTPNTWVARAGTGLNRFSYVMDGDYIYLTPAPVSVQDPGTPFSVDWMNNIEQGITAAQSPDSLSVGQAMPAGLGAGIVNAATGFAINGNQLEGIEKGTSGIWTYLKLTSGVLICWCQNTIGSVSISNNAQYQYYSDTMHLALPPGLLTSVDHVAISAYNDGLVFTTSHYWVENGNIYYRLMSSYQATTSAAAYISGFVIGKWK